ncbi:MAG: hypothetical protein ABIR16_06600 [Dokdonella sp.]
MRIFIAALLGAIIYFVWGMAAHTVLPIGEMGMKSPANEDVVIQAIATGTPEAGIYMLPWYDPAKMGDEAIETAWEAKAKANRFTYMVVADPQENPLSMTSNLIKQFITGLLGALIVAWMLAATPWGFGTRVLGSTGMGVFGWLVNTVPVTVWYQFPTAYLTGALIEQVVGWLLAGLGIAWWLGRK